MSRTFFCIKHPIQGCFLGWLAGGVGLLVGWLVGGVGLGWAGSDLI